MYIKYKCDLTPKIGDVLKHHFCHKGTVSCSNTDRGESYGHRLVKKQLCAFIKGSINKINLI